MSPNAHLSTILKPRLVSLQHLLKSHETNIMLMLLEAEDNPISSIVFEHQLKCVEYSIDNVKHQKMSFNAWSYLISWFKIFLFKSGNFAEFSLYFISPKILHGSVC